MPLCLVISIENLSNCWDSLKTVILQHSDEIRTSVNVAKAEKNNCMVYGVNLSAITMGNQQQSSEKENAQRLVSPIYIGIGLQAIGSPKW